MEKSKQNYITYKKLKAVRNFEKKKILKQVFLK